MTVVSSFSPLPDSPVVERYDLGDFRLESGAVLPHASITYVTLGALNAARTNAVLAPSWYGADWHGYDFLIGPGQALDPGRHYLILPEMFGSGGSSSPSNTAAPFDRSRFPAVAIRDNVAALHRLVGDHLGISRLQAVVGFSMGAQQALQMAVSHPDFAERVVAYCGAAKTYPHGFVRLESAVGALMADAVFADGDYQTPPLAGLTAWALHWSAWVYSQEWWRRELFKPAWATVADVLAAEIARQRNRDPNNLICQARAWQQHDVGATPGFGGSLEAALRSIDVPVLAMPSQSDLYFPLDEARDESQFLRHVTFRPIPSIWGHRAGAGRNPVDNAFLNAEIGAFLR
jgi:homoserine O-acetyltransferase